MLEKTLNQTETFNSWVIEMPKEIAKKEGYDFVSKVILTFENSFIKSEIIPPNSPQTTTEVNRIIGKYAQTFENFKKWQKNKVNYIASSSMNCRLLQLTEGLT